MSGTRWEQLRETRRNKRKRSHAGILAGQRWQAVAVTTRIKPETVQRILTDKNKKIMRTETNKQRAAEIFGNIGKVKISEPRVKRYDLMYFFGIWITSVKIYAESDDEAILEADAIFSNGIDHYPGGQNCRPLKNWRHGVALVDMDSRNGRRVKTYKENYITNENGEKVTF